MAMPRFLCAPALNPSSLPLLLRPLPFQKIMTTIDPALEDLIVYPPSESKSPTTSGGGGWRATNSLPASASASEDTTQAHHKALAHSQINQNQTVSPNLPEADAATSAVTHVQRNPRTIPETTNTPNASNSTPGGPKRRTRGGNAATAAPYPNPSSLTGVATSSPAAPSTPLQLDQQMLHNSGNLPRTSCPQPTGKIKNQLQARKTIAQALADCGDDQALRHAVLAAVNCEEYRQVRVLLSIDTPHLCAYPVVPHPVFVLRGRPQD